MSFTPGLMPTLRLDQDNQPEPALSIEDLHERVAYDPKTGEFTWRYREKGPKRWNTNHAGKTAGVDKEFAPGQFYRRIGILGKRYLAHRLAWFYVHEYWPPEVIDHINCDGLDNRLCNLRCATQAENVRNSRKQRNKQVDFKGVRHHRQSGKFVTAITTNGKTKSLGLFNTAEAAHAAYCKAAAQYHGKFMRTA